MLATSCAAYSKKLISSSRQGEYCDGGRKKNIHCQQNEKKKACLTNSPVITSRGTNLENKKYEYHRQANAKIKDSSLSFICKLTVPLDSNKIKQREKKILRISLHSFGLNMTEKYSELIEQYHRDGYVIIRDVIDERLIKECQEHVDFIQKKYPSIPGEQLHHPIMRNDPFWVRLISDQRLLDLAAVFGESFIKPDEGIALFSSHYFCKPPKTGMKVLWHQDGKSSLFFDLLCAVIDKMLFIFRCLLAIETNECRDNMVGDRS